jgi:hypothetical protein
MKISLFSASLIFVCRSVFAQQNIPEEINKVVLQSEASAHLSFLAADEMRGRNAGTNELDIAANYIRTQFRINNVKEAPGTMEYFQFVDLAKYPPPSKGTAAIGDEQFTLKDNLLVLDGSSVEWSGEFVYVGYGSLEDIADKDLTGKMVLALAGSKETDNINKVYQVSREKYATLKKAGAAGLVEILPSFQMPWPALVNYFHKEKWSLKEGQAIPFIWVKSQDLKSLSLNKSKNIKGRLSIEGSKPQFFAGRNVAGWVQGTDPVLKNEYVILTAHYDHVGITVENEKSDSIFNGARDNATGTVALLQAAKFLSRFPAKRSVLFVAVTCEEKGLLGSQWYVKHPLVPLQNHVLNFNCDGVGYNDKKRVTSISLGRTNMDDLLAQAAKTYNFSLGGDPDPSEGFYERSDQVSFAREGIPALKLQPGLAKMDEEILKYYHRPADEFYSLDMEYITQFYRTFVYAVHLVTNDGRKPSWVGGDKFEEAAKKLYK